jgi:hypothetical protein
MRRSRIIVLAIALAAGVAPAMQHSDANVAKISELGK